MIPAGSGVEGGAKRQALAKKGSLGLGEFDLGG